MSSRICLHWYRDIKAVQVSVPSCCEYTDRKPCGVLAHTEVAHEHLCLRPFMAMLSTLYWEKLACYPVMSAVPVERSGMRTCCYFLTLYLEAYYTSAFVLLVRSVTLFHVFIVSHHHVVLERILCVCVCVSGKRLKKINLMSTTFLEAKANST